MDVTFHPIQDHDIALDLAHRQIRAASTAWSGTVSQHVIGEVRNIVQTPSQRGESE